MALKVVMKPTVAVVVASMVATASRALAATVAVAEEADTEVTPEATLVCTIRMLLSKLYWHNMSIIFDIILPTISWSAQVHSIRFNYVIFQVVAEEAMEVVTEAVVEEAAATEVVVTEDTSKCPVSLVSFV